MNNISGKAYIDNGYIRNAYEITVFNNDITGGFHEAPITDYPGSKKITVFNNDITGGFHEAPITDYPGSKRRGIVL